MKYLIFFATIIFSLFCCTKKEYECFFITCNKNGYEINYPHYQASHYQIGNYEFINIYGGILDRDVQINLEDHFIITIPYPIMESYTIYDSITFSYADSNMNIYFAPLIYYDLLNDTTIIDFDACKLFIDIKKYNLSIGLISGTFNGILKNPSDFNDSLLINDGKFRLRIND